jgi:predicted ATP-grasp superfamily ATP-dependent carboligase
MTDSQIHALGALGDALAGRFNLTGIFGVDAVLGRDGLLHPVEVNPRYPASVELLEQSIGLSLFSLLRGDPLQPEAVDEQVRGKAIVHAKADGKARDLYELFPHDEVADVPAIGCEVAAGHPICTVFASATNREECLDKLRKMAGDVYTRGVS